MKTERWDFKRHYLCNFTILEELGFVERYKNGETFSNMAKEAGVSRGSLWKMVTQVYGIEPYQTSRYPSKYDLDTDVFSDIYNERSMYLLGLIYSDGHIGPKQKILRFVTTDKEQMENFKACLGTNKSYLNIPAKDGFKKQYRLNIAYRPMINDLRNYVPDLSRDTKSINKEIVKSNYFGHFLRGFFDGDGHVTKNGGQVIFTGNKSLMKNLREIIQFKYDLNASSLNKITGGFIEDSLVDTYHLSYYANKPCKTFYTIFYDNAKYYLSRKKEVFDDHWG